MLKRFSSRLSLRVNLRIARLHGRSGLQGTPDYDSTHEGAVGGRDSKLLTGNHKTGSGENQVDEGQIELMENNRPGEPRINRWLTGWAHMRARIRRRWRFIRMILSKEIPLEDRWLMWQLGRELTPVEKLDQEDYRKRKQENAVHKADAKRGEIVLRNALANLTFCDTSIDDGERHFRKLVEFDLVLYSPLAYYYHVDAEHLPYGVSIASMHVDDVCTHLSAAVRHPVEARIAMVNGHITGLWYVIQIAATGGIPTSCAFDDLLQRIAESAPALAYPTGLGRNGRLVIRNLADMPHLLILGETGGGKSNALNVILSTFIARNTPAAVRLAMVDLKGGGIELAHYEGIPHLLGADDGLVDVRNGIAENVDQAISILEYIAGENYQRQRMFKNAKVKNLGEWNRTHRKRRLPSIVVALDELALLMDAPENKKQLLAILRSLASTARAGGIHLVAVTQNADRSVINSTVKVNFPGRLVFQVPDASSSILAMGTGDAMFLSTVGRAIHKHGRDVEQVQTPFIKSKDIELIVQNAAAGRTTTKLATTQITPIELCKMSLEIWNGSLALRTVWNFLQMNGRPIEYQALNSILGSMENEIYTLEDRNYRVLPGAGRSSRRLEPVEDEK